MIIVHEKPKFFWLLKLFFPSADWGEGIIVTYGGKVYCNYYLTDSLIAHEQVHLNQQEGKIMWLWFLRYFFSPKFRLRVEIPAHRAEYESDKENLKFIASRLSGPLYKNMLTYQEAVKLITQ